MACTIVSNNIPSPEARETVNAAIQEGLSARAGDWNVIVYQPEDFPALVVRIQGPEEQRFNWTFLAGEQTTAFIRDRVAKGIAGCLTLQGGSDNTPV